MENNEKESITVVKDDTLSLDDVLKTVGFGGGKNDATKEEEVPTENAVVTEVKTPKKEIDLSNIPVGKSPLDQMAEEQSRGMVIEKEEEQQLKTMADDKFAGARQRLAEMDETIAKAKAVTITKRPESDVEMAQMMEQLDELDMNDLDRLNQQKAAAEAGKDVNLVQEESLLGQNVDSATTIIDADLGTGNNMFIPRETVSDKKEEEKKESSEDAVAEDEDDDLSRGAVTVLIDKTNPGEGESNGLAFTEEEREKIRAATRIDLVQVNKLKVNVGKVQKPSLTFLEAYKTNKMNLASDAVSMTFPASKFRATFRGLTFGEYMDIALSANDPTDVEKTRKKLSVFYNAMIDCSIGLFPTFDDFLRNFAIVDMQLAVYAIYIATNPEMMELGLECRAENCMTKFTCAFKPKTLLRIEQLGDYYKAAMKEVAEANGQDAIDIHNTSSTVERSLIELPMSGYAVEMGLRSCYELLNETLPYSNDIEKVMTERYPEDVNRVHEIIGYLTNYVSAVFAKDENGEFTIRFSDINDIVDALYHLPNMDFEIISATVSQAEEDYSVSFGVVNIKCPKCGRVTPFIEVNINNEVFQTIQTQANTTIERKSLPRL